GAAPKLWIGPILAGIKQRPELAGFLLELQNVIRDLIGRAIDDELLANHIERDLIVRLLAIGFEELDAAVFLELREKRPVVIDVGAIRVRRIGFGCGGILGNEHAFRDAPISRVRGAAASFATFGIARPMAFDPGGHEEVRRDRVPATDGGLGYSLREWSHRR